MLSIDDPHWETSWAMMSCDNGSHPVSRQETLSKQVLPLPDYSLHLLETRLKRTCCSIWPVKVGDPPIVKDVVFEVWLVETGWPEEVVPVSPRVISRMVCFILRL